jgi:predicted deacetylase
MAHILVIANETAASKTLLDAVRREAEAGDDRVTVIAPVNEPRQGYVVYEDTRRASARRRLERSLAALREAGIHAQGFVADSGPVQATKDALAQLEPAVDEIVVSTHTPERSGWMRREVVADIERAAGGIPVTHVVASSDDLQKNVLVIANRTVLSDDLLGRIRKRAQDPPVGFLIVAPQEDEAVADEHGADQTDADRRLRRALTELRSEGINAHGQIVHPDPYTAAMNAINDERIDELIVSTFPNQKSGWLRRDLVERLRKDTRLPVEHVIDTRVREEVRA